MQDEDEPKGAVKPFPSQFKQDVAYCIEQEFVNDGFVGECQIVKLVWQRKHVVKILDGQ
jgi:hypothetical protein